MAILFKKTYVILALFLCVSYALFPVVTLEELKDACNENQHESRVKILRTLMNRCKNIITKNNKKKHILDQEVIYHQNRLLTDVFNHKQFCLLVEYLEVLNVRAMLQSESSHHYCKKILSDFITLIRHGEAYNIGIEKGDKFYESDFFEKSDYYDKAVHAYADILCKKESLSEFYNTLFIATIKFFARFWTRAWDQEYE